MRINVLRRQRERQAAGELHLWPIGLVLVSAFLLTVAGLAGLSWLAWAVLNYPRIERSSGISLHDTVSVVQVVLATVAGVGALVALIVAYRKQKVAEADSAHDRTRVFNERFTAVASQLGDERPAVRLAGVHAMSGLADDWIGNRQTCVDVLCAYLRLPYEPDPGEDAPTPERSRFQANREVRQTVIRILAAHLQGDATVSWQGLNLDFTGIVFDEADFSGAIFSDGKVSFKNAEFTGNIDFLNAEFCGADVTFEAARFVAGVARFDSKFSGGNVSFAHANFTGGLIQFSSTFAGSWVQFFDATFSGGTVHYFARFTAGYVGFGVSKFNGSTVSFSGSEFSGGEVDFSATSFSGGKVDFTDAIFRGGKVSFSEVRDWSAPPAGLDITHPPKGVGPVNFA